MLERVLKHNVNVYEPQYINWNTERFKKIGDKADFASHAVFDGTHEVIKNDDSMIDRLVERL